MHAVVRPDSHHFVRNDAADFVGSVGAEADAVGKLQDRTAIGQRRRIAAVGVTAPRATGTGAEDEPGVIVLHDRGKFLCG